MQQRREVRPGEYVINRGVDSDAERDDCRRMLKNNGCRTVRFETRQVSNPYMDASEVHLTAHGYMALIEGTPGFEPL